MKVLYSVLCIVAFMSSVQAKEVPFDLPKDMYSLRTGKALDSAYDCNMSEIVGDTEFPGDCPDTSMHHE